MRNCASCKIERASQAAECEGLAPGARIRACSAVAGWTVFLGSPQHHSWATRVYRALRPLRCVGFVQRSQHPCNRGPGEKPKVIDRRYLRPDEATADRRRRPPWTLSVPRQGFGAAGLSPWTTSIRSLRAAMSRAAGLAQAAADRHRPVCV